MSAATSSGAGMPATVPKPNTSLNAGGMPYTGTPPVRYSAAPKPTDAIPKVIINGDTLNTATPMPLMTPMTVPAAMPTNEPSAIASHTASGINACAATMAVAPTTEVSARTVPTDKSKPPVTIANICPNDTKVRYTDWRATLTKFRQVRKLSDSNVNTMSAAMRRNGSTPRRTNNAFGNRDARMRAVDFMQIHGGRSSPARGLR